MQTGPGKRGLAVRAAVVLTLASLAPSLAAGVAAGSTDEDPCASALCTPSTPVLKGEDNGKRADRVRLNSISQDAGREARLIRLEGSGERTIVATATLNDKGNARFVVADRNGRRYTKYLARIPATDTEPAQTSNRLRVR